MTRDRAGASVMTIFAKPGPVAASHAVEVLRLHRSSTRRQETYLQPVASDQAARVLQNAVTMSTLKRFDRFSSFWPPRTQNFAETVTPRLLAAGGGTGDKTGRPAPDRENPIERQL